MATKILTREEWATVTPPFHFIAIRSDTWSQVHRDMIVKWLEAHTGKGWVYYDGNKTYVFQNAGDYLAFKMWIKDDPFANDDGVIDDA